MQCTLMGTSRFWQEVRDAYDLLDTNSITVLLPPRSVLENGVSYVRYDMEMQERSKPGEPSETALQRLREHLDALKISDFLYVVNPHNDFSYIQTFAAGYAFALGKSIFSQCRVENPPAGAFVTIYPPRELVEFLKTQPNLKM